MERILVIQRIVDKKMSQEAGAEALGVCPRQVRRLIARYRGEGAPGLRRKPSGGNRRFSEAFKAEVMGHVGRTYRDFGPTLASEELWAREGLKVSRETLRNWMMGAGLWVGRAQHKARIHQSRPRRPRRGELVQIDGSLHDWFEGRAPKCCLLVMIDDATSELMYMRFEPTETTMGYMRCLEGYLPAHGRPLAFYSDKHSIFRKTARQCVDHRVEGTQFHRALGALGIQLMCAPSPQAKGRVERANGTLQDRLIKKMRLAGVSSMAEGNAFLEGYRLMHNARFGVAPEDLEDAHRPLQKSVQDLELILSHQETRTISQNLEVTHGRKIYQIQGVRQGYRLRGAGVTIYETTKGETILRNKEKRLSYKVFERSSLPKEADDKTINALVDELLGCYPQGPQGGFSAAGY